MGNEFTAEDLVKSSTFEFGELGLIDIVERNDSKKKLVSYNNKKKIKHKVKRKKCMSHPEDI